MTQTNPGPVRSRVGSEFRDVQVDYSTGPTPDHGPLETTPQPLREPSVALQPPIDKVRPQRPAPEIISDYCESDNLKQSAPLRSNTIGLKNNSGQSKITRPRKCQFHHCHPIPYYDNHEVEPENRLCINENLCRIFERSIAGPGILERVC